MLEAVAKPDLPTHIFKYLYIIPSESLLTDLDLLLSTSIVEVISPEFLREWKLIARMSLPSPSNS